MFIVFNPVFPIYPYRADGVTLTVRSLRFLQLSDSNDMNNFCDVYKNSPLKRQTVITCLNTLKKSMADDDAISCLVLGTEDKSIYVLDPEAFTVLAAVSCGVNIVTEHVTFSLFFIFFSVRLLSVLRGHSFFPSPPQRPMTSDFEGFSIPDFIHYIYFPILILVKEPVFPF